MSVRKVLALLAVMLSATSIPAYAADVLIKDARIVDPAAETITPGFIVITGERIAQVLDKAPPDFDGEVLDAGGALCHSRPLRFARPPGCQPTAEG